MPLCSPIRDKLAWEITLLQLRLPKAFSTDAAIKNCPINYMAKRKVAFNSGKNVLQRLFSGIELMPTEETDSKSNWVKNGINWNHMLLPPLWERSWKNIARKWCLCVTVKREICLKELLCCLRRIFDKENWAQRHFSHQNVFEELRSRVHFLRSC